MKKAFEVRGYRAAQVVALVVIEVGHSADYVPDSLELQELDLNWVAADGWYDDEVIMTEIEDLGEVEEEEQDGI